MTAKPTPYGTLGHYAIGALSGAVAAGSGAGSQIFHGRWTDATRFGVIYELTLEEFFNTTAFATGRFQFDLVFIRNWSVDGSGGTALNLGTNNQKLRTSMGASLFGALRMATTAALAAGTSTLDTQPLKMIGGRVGIVATKHNIPQSMVVTTAECASGPGIPLWDSGQRNEHPIVLASNGGSTSDGFALRSSVPGTGVWSIVANMRWCEVTAI